MSFLHLYHDWENKNTILWPASWYIFVRHLSCNQIILVCTNLLICIYVTRCDIIAMKSNCKERIFCFHSPKENSINLSPSSKLNIRWGMLMSCYKNTASFTESAEISLIPDLKQLKFLFILDGYYYCTLIDCTKRYYLWFIFR